MHKNHKAACICMLTLLLYSCNSIASYYFGYMFVFLLFVFSGATMQSKIQLRIKLDTHK